MAKILLTPEAATDIQNLDGSVRLEVMTAIAKLQADPVRYGKSLGHKAGINLSGFMSIRAGKRIRIIYSVENDTVIIRVIGRRESFSVHQTARERIVALNDLTSSELKNLGKLLTETRMGQHRDS